MYSDVRFPCFSILFETFVTNTIHLSGAWKAQESEKLGFPYTKYVDVRAAWPHAGLAVRDQVASVFAASSAPGANGTERAKTSASIHLAWLWRNTTQGKTSFPCDIPCYRFKVQRSIHVIPWADSTARLCKKHRIHFWTGIGV